MKKTGVASAATIVALNGFKMEVLASGSGSCPVTQFAIGFFYTQYQTFEPLDQAAANQLVAALAGTPPANNYTMGPSSIHYGYGCGTEPLNPAKIYQTQNTVTPAGSGNNVYVTHAVTYASDTLKITHNHN